MLIKRLSDLEDICLDFFAWLLPFGRLAKIVDCLFDILVGLEGRLGTALSADDQTACEEGQAK